MELEVPWSINRAKSLEQPAGGFLGGDLLYAVVTSSPEVWVADPELASGLKTAVSMLTEISGYVKQAIEARVSCVALWGG
ncbi:hypothetical protein [Streptomyces sp. NPDC093591]|uniref:hypothetical protein n=1 Tax=Streptomyces sp. NPDC093591 TaxID=3366044 RepID=UPI00380C321C